MTTIEAFRELVFRKDTVSKTSMTKSERSQFRAYFKGKIKNKRPKYDTMEMYLIEYGATKKPEIWNI
jgi:hypothetical protein